jgi:general stress protein 26
LPCGLKLQCHPESRAGGQAQKLGLEAADEVRSEAIGEPFRRSPIPWPDLQNLETPPMADEKNPRDKLYEMIDKVKIAVLTTVEKDGGLHSRPMSNQEADENGDLWFFLDKTSALAETIKANPKVALGYSDPSGDNYVSVSGSGELVTDRGTIDAKWTEDVAAWFEGGKQNPNVALLKVNPDEGEYWDTSSSALATAVGYIKSKLGKGEGSDVVENKKVAL